MKRTQQKRTLIARVSYAQWLAVKAWAKADKVKTSRVLRDLIDRGQGINTSNGGARPMPTPANQPGRIFARR